MKKIYSLTTLGLLLAGSLQAQVIPFMDLVKTPQTSFETPIMRLVMTSGTGTAQEKVATGWRNNNRFTGLMDAKGNQTLYVGESWDTVANVWVQDSKMAQSITYDGSGKVTAATFTMEQDGDKVMRRDMTFTYDGSGKYLPIHSLDTVWTPTAMGYNGIDSMVYNGAGKVEQRVFARALFGMYQVASRYKYTYDGAGNMIEKLEQDYSSSTSSWDNNMRYTYSYYASGKVRSIYEENFNDPNWEGSDLDSFLYDANGRMTSKINYSPNGPVWIGDDREDYTYTGDNLTEVVNINWIGSGWVNEKKIILTYTGSALANGVEHPWNGSAWSSDTTSLVTWTSGPTGLSQLSKDVISVYPNPANDHIAVQGLNGTFTASVYNLQGKVCLQQELNSNQAELNIASLEQGVYFIAIENGSNRMVTRFVKQ